MRNTRGNHELLQLGLIQVQAFARQVQLDVRFISMPADEVGRWERSFGRSLTDSQILDLWKEGKAETIYAQGVKTMNGVNAIIENVDERIYPTEMDKTRPAREGDNPREEWKQTYGGFETRRVGFILNITPTLSPGSTINLVVLPEQVRDLGDDKTAPEDLQPILRQFRSWNITSSIVIQNGETLAIGNSTSLDGEKRQYLLITATVVDATGSPVHLPDGAEADETE